MTKRQPDDKACQFCGSRFIPKKSWQKFCNTTCHNKFWSARRVNPDDRFVELEVRIGKLEEYVREREAK